MAASEQRARPVTDLSRPVSACANPAALPVLVQCPLLQAPRAPGSWRSPLRHTGNPIARSLSLGHSALRCFFCSYPCQHIHVRPPGVAAGLFRNLRADCVRTGLHGRVMDGRPDPHLTHPHARPRIQSSIYFCAMWRRRAPADVPCRGLAGRCTRNPGGRVLRAVA